MKGGVKRRMKCCVAGGASMIADPAQFETGRRNYLAVKKTFWKLGFLYRRGEDVGGSETRTLRSRPRNRADRPAKGHGSGTDFCPGCCQSDEKGRK